MADLFIYGTLQDKEVCEKVLDRSVQDEAMIPSFAPDFAIYQVAGVSYPCLLPEEGETAQGFLLTNLSQEDLARLDRFEGENYTRVPITIMVNGYAYESCYYYPDANLETDGAWDFASWQANAKDAFLSRDFDLDGVRVPKGRT